MNLSFTWVHYTYLFIYQVLFFESTSQIRTFKLQLKIWRGKKIYVFHYYNGKKRRRMEEPTIWSRETWNRLHRTLTFKRLLKFRQ